MNHPLYSWDEFFSDPSNPSSTKKHEVYLINQTFTESSHYVCNCMFMNCESSEGGAILVLTSTSILIEATTFISCQAANAGGSIFFDATGNCILSRVCSIQSKTNGIGQFSWVYLIESTKYRNFMKDCAVSYTDNEGYSYEMYLQFGKILISSVNSSKNRCYSNSGPIVCPIDYVDYSYCVISFSCFANNYAKNYICVYFEIIHGNYEMRACNVINNTQASPERGTVFAAHFLSVYDSCIKGNNATYSLYGYEYNDYGQINVFNCTYDKQIFRAAVRSSAENEFTNFLVFIETAGCEADIAAMNKKRIRPITCACNKVVIDLLFAFKLTCLILHCE